MPTSFILRIIAAFVPQQVRCPGHVTLNILLPVSFDWICGWSTTRQELSSCNESISVAAS